MSKDENYNADLNYELIRLVKLHPNVYKYRKDFKDINKHSWSVIIIDFNSNTGSKATVSQIINQWKELKREFTKYISELKKYVASGSAQQPEKEQWLYYTEMGFMADKIAHRETESNFSLYIADLYETSSCGEIDGRGADIEKGYSMHQIESQESGLGINNINKASSSNNELANEYLKVILDAWSKVPENQRNKCFI